MDTIIRDLWPPEAIEAIHTTSLALLERVGVRVESPAAHEVLERAGCGEAPNGRMLIPRQLVDEATAAGRRRYTLVARDATRSLEIDPDPAQIYVHNMGGARDIGDARSGASRRATIVDQADLARVMHHIVNQHTITPMVQPDDVPVELEPLYSYLMVALETDKYVGGPGISFAYQARHLVAMAEAVAGRVGGGGVYPLDLAFSPVSPLLLGADVTDALVDSVARGGIACEILPCPLAGTTAPAPLAAALALQNAEVLAGLVLVQTVAPGTPCYYGPRLSSVDPRTGAITSGAPETGGASIPAILLARRYGMACDCYGPSTDSRVADAQLGIEHAQNALLGMLARPRFLSGVGDLQAGAAAAFEAIVIDDEVLNYAFQALKPHAFDHDALDVEAIAEGVLSNKGFLSTKQTRRYLRSEYGAPLLAFRGGAEEWRTSARSGLVDAAAEKVAEFLARPPVGLPDDVAEALCAEIDVCAAELGLAEWPDPRRLVAARIDKAG
jgi:trimethylamine---corrinoid protein Co-methyltransferase